MSNGTNFLSLRERFELQYMPVPWSGCWLWIGHVGSRGYGYIKDHYKTKLAHRISYQLFRGKIPAMLQVCHSCDIPDCVNPAHLFLGTSQENTADKMTKGRYKCLTGELHPGAKLTAADIKIIRASSELGIELAKRFSVSPSTISQIRHYRRWKQANNRGGL